MDNSNLYLHPDSLKEIIQKASSDSGEDMKMSVDEERADNDYKINTGL